jgi:hypothetical protein
MCVLCSGYRSSVEYLGLKWGCDDEQTVCDFDTPFNHNHKPLSYWRLDWRRSDRGSLTL